MRVVVFCDNFSVVHMINNSSSSCRNCMVLIRLIVLESLYQNVRVFAKHIRTKKNGAADALSRMQLKKFKYLRRAKNMDLEPTQIPPAHLAYQESKGKKLIHILLIIYLQVGRDAVKPGANLIVLDLIHPLFHPVTCGM